MPHTGWAILEWKGWGVPRPVSSPMVCATRPLLAQAPVLACNEERGSDGSLPPYAGPLVGLWRGERDEAGRGPLKHTPKVLFMSMLNLTENAYSQARRKATGRKKTNGRNVVEVEAKAFNDKLKLYMCRKILSPSLEKYVSLINAWKKNDIITVII